MFLIPQHIRNTLHSCLTESPADGPHTALLLLPQGHVLCTASTSDADWTASEAVDGKDEVEDLSNGVDGLKADDADGNEDEDDEPYIASPERNRMLRGLAKSQWAAREAERDDQRRDGGGESGEHDDGDFLEDLKVECELGRLLLIPITIPTYTSTSNNPLSLNANYDPSGFRPPNAFGYRPTADADSRGAGREKERTVMLVLNGVKGVGWDRLHAKAELFKERFRTTAPYTSSGAR